MKRLWILLCLGGLLGAQAPLRIVAVVRRGLPPYEEGERLYQLDGGADKGLRVGQRMVVRRPGEAAALGHLRLTDVRGSLAEGNFQSAGGLHPMRGDLVWREELAALPELHAEGSEAWPRLAAPQQPGPPPPQEGVLFFLPQRAELSPAGQAKVADWVSAWGRGGTWTVQIPASRALSPALQKQRAQTLKAALQAQGVETVQLDATARKAEGRFDPAWVRRSE